MLCCAPSSAECFILPRVGQPPPRQLPAGCESIEAIPPISSYRLENRAVPIPTAALRSLAAGSLAVDEPGSKKRCSVVMAELG